MTMIYSHFVNSNAIVIKTSESIRHDHRNVNMVLKMPAPDISK